MATVNKQYFREEFDALKVEFECLTANGKMAAESRALFQAMLMLFEVLMAVFMEKRTPKDNRNSSLPSSQTAKEDNTATQPGAKGKGKSQNDLLSLGVSCGIYFVSCRLYFRGLTPDMRRKARVKWVDSE